MKILRILASLVAVLVSSVTTLAQVTLGGVTAATTVLNAVTNESALIELRVTDTSGAANRFYVRDNNATITNRTVPAYKIVLQYPTNQIVAYTNPAGVAVTVTNNILYTETVTQAEVTGPARLITMLSLPANGSIVFLPTTPAGVTYGIQLYSLGTTSFSLEYLNLP